MTTIPSLFQPFSLRGLQLRNRIVLPPMCQYQAIGRDGMVTDWHLQHYGARAAGGFGLIVAEASAICPEGRISPQCAGMWTDEQAQAWRRIVDCVHSQGSAMGIQLIHAGRKASTFPMLPGFHPGSVPIADGGWETSAPSPVAFPKLRTPYAMTREEIQQIPVLFAQAAARSVAAGFDLVQIHAAHGYLLHQFLSPLSNQRDDDYGGSFANRTRLVHEVVDAVREAVGPDYPVSVRLSATDWFDDDSSVDAWSLADSVQLCQDLAARGVDLIDVSSGGVAPAPILTGPGYQVPFAAAIKKHVSVPVAAVGQLGDSALAQQVLDEGKADLINVGRAALFDAAWPVRAAHALGLDRSDWPVAPSYHRGEWR
ncbi:MAG: NADH:flavin oxidoreductase/NADH oxidase [Corynebacterium sp.]|uniref:NADH:flavin oxidoreductase/NADH oxidase n=1 Tax=Corynebacterium sp. TaxID=1720 RepID=UPI0026DD5061|nr:NADH:flavin oxidoreductase/NADH oxidase [Corynebacterium sp.]MDO4761691.1 NADH:flavin oxidoreductase/NADH oxidase [Corynebacterium sp.]